MRIRNRWALAISLHNNPTLIKHRRHEDTIGGGPEKVSVTDMDTTTTDTDDTKSGNGFGTLVASGYSLYVPVGL
jgi:hypothetical protein